MERYGGDGGEGGGEFERLGEMEGGRDRTNEGINYNYVIHAWD